MEKQKEPRIEIVPPAIKRTAQIGSPYHQRLDVADENRRYIDSLGMREYIKMKNSPLPQQSQAPHLPLRLRGDLLHNFIRDIEVGGDTLNVVILLKRIDQLQHLNRIIRIQIDRVGRNS